MSVFRNLVVLASLSLVGCRERPFFSEEPFAFDPPRLPSARGLIVTTNNGDDTLTLVDPVARAKVGTLPVGFVPVELEGPHHAAADPQGRFFYVNLSEAVAGSGSGPHGAHGAGATPGYVLKFDSETLEQVGFAAVDPNPGDVVLSPDGATIYVTHYDLLKMAKAGAQGNIRLGDSNLIAIDADSMETKKSVPLCPLAHGARLSNDGKALFVSCGTDEIAIVDVSDPSFPVKRVLLPGQTEDLSCARCPYALAVAPDDKVYVSTIGPNGGASGGGSLHVFDPATGAFDSTQTISLCGRAVFAAFFGTAADYAIYLPEQGPCGDSVRVYRNRPAGTALASAGKIVFSAAQCTNAHMMNVSDDGSEGRLICEGDHVGAGTFAFLNLSNLTLHSSIPIGVFPDGLAAVR